RPVHRRRRGRLRREQPVRRRPRDRARPRGRRHGLARPPAAAPAGRFCPARGAHARGGRSRHGGDRDDPRQPRDRDRPPAHAPRRPARAHPHRRQRLPRRQQAVDQARGSGVPNHPARVLRRRDRARRRAPGSCARAAGRGRRCRV
ncbi:MAG: hypothetical protein AVDCRST_MAG89-3409, partial [uncultured Gemmatimonadetes bacterium]